MVEEEPVEEKNVCLTGNCSNRKTGPDVLDVSGGKLVDTHSFLGRGL